MQTPKIHCYVSSTVGAVVVGSLSLIASFIGLIFSVISLSHVYAPPGEWTYFPYGLEDLNSMMLCLGIGMSSTSMIYGAIKEKHAFMFPWLGLCVSATGAALCFFFAVVISYIVSWDFGRRLQDFAAMCGTAMAISTLGIILCAIVYNHYKQIISKKPTQSAHPYTMSDTTIKSPIIYQKV